MGARGACGGRISLAIAVFAAVLLLPGAALAATVVNGDFETGNLSGWHAERATGFGDWYVYSDPLGPIPGQSDIEPLPNPPQGRFAAVADELNPDTVILWQDIALEPGRRHQLNLTTFYESYEDISVPAPDTLSVDEEAIGKQVNQQFRIDLMKPGAPLESIAPGDVLQPIFATKPGDPRKMAPTRLTVGLNPFAGQTVRLRFAVAAGEEALLAGVDGVRVFSRPATGPGSVANAIEVRGVKPDPRTGTVLLTLGLPGPGHLLAKRPGKIRTLSRNVSQERTLRVRLRPTPATHRLLAHRHSLSQKIGLSFEPIGGLKGTRKLSLPLRLSTPKR
jgi:hypothetical protein